MSQNEQPLNREQIINRVKGQAEAGKRKEAAEKRFELVKYYAMHAPPYPAKYTSHLGTSYYAKEVAKWRWDYGEAMVAELEKRCG